MARKTPEEAAATREALIDAAEQVFLEKGVSQATLADVATQAGMTRGAIYWHFKNKADLMYAMFERVQLPLEALSGVCIDEKSPDPLEAIRRHCVRALIETARDERRRRVFTILFQRFEMDARDEQFVARIRNTFLECRAQFLGLIEQAMDLGQLPADADANRAVFILQACFTGTLYNWLFQPDTLNLEGEAEMVVDSALRGLGARQSLASVA